MLSKVIFKKSFLRWTIWRWGKNRKNLTYVSTSKFFGEGLQLPKEEERQHILDEHESDGLFTPKF